MTNNQLLKKLSEDMKMRNFSQYTYDAYMGKTREMISILTNNYQCVRRKERYIRF